MIKAITLIFAALAISAFGKPASTRWKTAPKTHRHGVGMRCPHCGQTWDAIPKGLKVWEVRHLKQEMAKFYALHLRVRHGI